MSAAIRLRMQRKPDSERASLISLGDALCRENPFYNNLAKIFMYVLTRPATIDREALRELVRDMTKNALVFKSYSVFKEFGLNLYREEVRFMFSHGDSDADVVMALIGAIKDKYDKDRSMIEPVIVWAEENKADIESECAKLAVYDYSGELALEQGDTHESSALSLLQEAEMHSNKAKELRERAMRLLRNNEL